MRLRNLTDSHAVSAFIPLWFFPIFVIGLFSYTALAQKELTNIDVVNMVREHIAIPIIVNSIRDNTGRYSLTPGDLSQLKKQGVPDQVILAMQENAHRASAERRPATRTSVDSCNDLGNKIWKTLDVSTGFEKTERREVYCQPHGEDHIEVSVSCAEDVTVRLAYISADKTLHIPVTHLGFGIDAFVSRVLYVTPRSPVAPEHPVSDYVSKPLIYLPTASNEIAIKFPGNDLKPAAFPVDRQRFFDADRVSFELPVSNSRNGYDDSATKIKVTFNPQDTGFKSFASTCPGYKSRSEVAPPPIISPSSKSDELPSPQQKISSGGAKVNLKKSPPPVVPADFPAGASATVVLDVTIDESGHVSNAKVNSLHGSLNGKSWTPPPSIGDAAANAVRSWEYSPFLRNGQPTPTSTSVNVMFPVAK